MGRREATWGLGVDGVAIKLWVVRYAIDLRFTRLATLSSVKKAVRSLRAGCERRQDQGAKYPEPSEEQAEVVAGCGKNGVGGVADGESEEVWAHVVVGFAVANDRLDRGSSSEGAFDGLGQAAFHASDIDLEAGGSQPKCDAGWEKLFHRQIPRKLVEKTSAGVR